MNDNFWRVEVYDPKVGESGVYYSFFLRFRCDWGSKMSEWVARTWAETLIQSDTSNFIEWFNRLEIFLEPSNELAKPKNLSGYDVGRSTSIWIEEAPLGSQLHNRAALGFLLNRLSCELAAQLPAVVLPVR